MHTTAPTSHKNYFTYGAFLDYLMIMLFASGYVERITMWRRVSVCVFAAAVILYAGSIYRTLSKNRAFVITGLSLILLFILCIIFSVSDAYTVTNLKGLFYAFCPAATFGIMAAEGIEPLTEYFTKRVPLFNAVYLVHLYILSRQIKGTGFMIKASWLAENPYYKDHCSGIFGFSGTHYAALFSVFMLLLNLQYLPAIRDRRRRILFLLYTLALEAVMLYCAAFSDNMALYFIAPFFAVLYFFMSDPDAGISKYLYDHLATIIGAAALACLAFFAVMSLPAVQEYAGSVSNRLYALLHFSSVRVKGSNERLAIVAEALSSSRGWKFGYGIGESPWKGLNLNGYAHFGISSIGSMIYLCGIWTYVCFVLFYALMSTNVVETDPVLSVYKNKARTVTILAMLVLTVYTNMFIDMRNMVLYFMIFTAMYMRLYRHFSNSDRL